MSRLLTTAEAAARIGRTPKTLRNWRAKRAHLPYVTSSAGRFAGYRESDVREYIAALTVVELAR
jgi:predicted DNA-binding transcriptional regulator AlpA